MDELGYFLDSISKQSVEDADVAAYSKIREERNTLKKGLVSKKEVVLDNLENSLPIRVTCLENDKGTTIY